jgi:maltose O-acetyltransferase
VFGFRSAARLGSGEILLQARHPIAKLVIGKSNAFSNNVSIVANEQITLGNACRIGDLVAIYDCDFHEVNPATRHASPGATKPVHIGNNVWLGSRVIVLKGVVIGDNSVVGAGSVVTKSIPANCLAAGVPAKVIRLLSRPD